MSAPCQFSGMSSPLAYPYNTRKTWRRPRTPREKGAVHYLKAPLLLPLILARQLGSHQISLGRMEAYGECRSGIAMLVVHSTIWSMFPAPLFTCFAKGEHSMRVRRPGMRE